MAGLAQHLGARIEVLVDAMAEAHQHEIVVLVLGALHEFGDAVLAADLHQHLEDRFVGAAMRRTPQRGDAGGDAGEGIGAGRAGETHRRGRGVLLVIGMEDEDLVHRLGEDRADLHFLARHAERHVQEVLGVIERVLRIHERLADRVFVGHRRDRRHFRDQPVRGDHALRRIGDVG